MHALRLSKIPEYVKRIDKETVRSGNYQRYIGVFFSFILISLISTYVIYRVFFTQAAPASIVHDTQVDFQAGLQNGRNGFKPGMPFY